MKRRLIVSAVIVVSLAGAQLQANQRPNQSSQTPEQLTVAANRPLRLTIPAWLDPTPQRLGVLTIAPPEWRGEMVRVSLPIGDLTMRAGRAIGQAQYRRAEQKARKKVAQAIKDFQSQR